MFFEKIFEIIGIVFCLFHLAKWIMYNAPRCCSDYEKRH